MDCDLGQDSLRRHRLVPFVRTTVELIWLTGAQPRRRCPTPVADDADGADANTGIGCG